MADLDAVLISADVIFVLSLMEQSCDDLSIESVLWLLEPEAWTLQRQVVLNNEAKRCTWKPIVVDELRLRVVFWGLCVLIAQTGGFKTAKISHLERWIKALELKTNCRQRTSTSDCPLGTLCSDRSNWRLQHCKDKSFWMLERIVRVEDELSPTNLDFGLSSGDSVFWSLELEASTLQGQVVLNDGSNKPVKLKNNCRSRTSTSGCLLGTHSDGSNWRF